MNFSEDESGGEGDMLLGCALCIGFGVVFLATIAVIVAVAWRFLKWGFGL